MGRKEQGDDYDFWVVLHVMTHIRSSEMGPKRDPSVALQITVLF